MRKQRDLSGFYRHLFKQKLGDDKEEEAVKTEENKEKSDATKYNKDIR